MSSFSFLRLNLPSFQISRTIRQNQTRSLSSRNPWYFPLVSTLNSEWHCRSSRHCLWPQINGFESVVLVPLTSLKYRNASKQKQKSSAIHHSTGAIGILPWTPRRMGFQKKTLRQEHYFAFVTYPFLTKSQTLLNGHPMSFLQKIFSANIAINIITCC